MQMAPRYFYVIPYKDVFREKTLTFKKKDAIGNDLTKFQHRKMPYTQESTNGLTWSPVVNTSEPLASQGHACAPPPLFSGGCLEVFHPPTSQGMVLAPLGPLEK